MIKELLHKIIFYLMIGLLTTTVSCQETEPDDDINEEIEIIEEEEEEEWIPLNVKASAYNSIEAQTKKGNVGVAAWGDLLTPGVKAIAVSDDLIERGLTHNTRVKIEGLEGVFLVKDRMHSRWRNKIDIYMGTDVKKARRWGVKRVNISYAPPEEIIE